MTGLVQKWLRGGIERLRFDHFMGEALYAEGLGYYRRPGVKVGSRGDFSTSASLSDGLGKAIGRFLRAEIRLSENGKPGPKRLVEIGGGNGRMHAQVCRELGWAIRRKWESHLVEISEEHRKLQQAALKTFWGGQRGIWHEDLEELSRNSPNSSIQQGAGAGDSIVFSNELVDAFPCRVLCWNGDVWQELYVQVEETGILREIFLDLPVEELEELKSISSALEHFAKTDVMTGQRVEIQQSFYVFMKELVKIADRLSVLTIDYGDKVEDLYYRRKPGTLRGYFKQMRMDGAELYARVGHQDLTLDVNFSDLIKWGNEMGLELAGWMTQKEFLEKWGDRKGEKVEAYLRDEMGAGTAFKVLWQRLGGQT